MTGNMTRRETITVLGNIAAAGLLPFIAGARQVSAGADSEHGDNKERRRELYNLLGELPEKNRPITAETISVENTGNYILEKLLLDLNGLESVPAYFAKPVKAQKPTPVIIYNHAHGGDYSLGKDEFINGRGALQKPPYAEELTRLGYSGLCIDISCLTDYQSLIDSRGLDEHGIYYYVPKLMKHFTTSQINGLISPRPHLGLAGRYARLTPIKGLEKIDRDMKEIYRRDNAPGAWKLSIYDIAHFETAAMRKEIVDYLDKWL